ncbi:MAG: hypothetical protein AMS18_07300 [Gemmatimonas sp. SG8_17]|nr:MAG: hypothetical protein AMS18_07300 [Gemmatimonas sp. SG8_17]
MESVHSDSAAKRHPIQVVARRSGLTADVLRAWEKRYTVVTPGRSKGGRRLYSDSDIERLRLIREAVAGGRRVGQLAHLQVDELRDLVQEDRREAVSPAEFGPGRMAQEDAAVFLAECLDAVRALDSNWLRSVFGRAIIALQPSVFIESVVTPLMHRIGALWSEGRLSPGHEHLASSVVRNTLAEVIVVLQPNNGAPRIVVATPAHQHHEIGAILVAATAQLDGWHVTYLGQDLPASDLARAAEQTEARALALSITHPPGDPRLVAELRALRQELPDDTALIVGGQAVQSYRKVLESVGALRVAGVQEFREKLRELAPPNGKTLQS